MKMVYINRESDWMTNGRIKRWTIVDENGAFQSKFGCWKTRKALLEEFARLNDGAYLLGAGLKTYDL